MDQIFQTKLKKYSKIWGVSNSDILGHCRKSPLPEIRAQIIYDLRFNHDYTFKYLGRLMNRDHSSIIHLYRKMEFNVYGKMVCNQPA